MSNIFKLEDIKAGYLIEVEVTERSGDKHNMYMTVSTCEILKDVMGLACTNPGWHWWSMQEWSDRLIYISPRAAYRIVKVYGPTPPMCALDNSTEDRELLWERKEPKRMTLSEIQKALGYDIEIVSEKEG